MKNVVTTSCLWCAKASLLQPNFLQAEFNVKNNLVDIEDCQEDTFSTKDKKGKFKIK